MNDGNNRGLSVPSTEADQQEAVRPPSLPASKELQQYGGQAVIEGVMMRSPHYFAVACRKPDGSIVVKCEEVDKTILGKLGRMRWLKWPFVRGSFALLDAMALGTRALAYASNIQLEAEQNKVADSQDGIGSYNESPTSAQIFEEEVTASAASIVNGMPVATTARMTRTGRINDIAIGGTIIFSLVFAILLFKLIPTSITQVLQHFNIVHVSAGSSRDRELNILDGIFRMAIFFGYIILISQMKQIKRVFMYHGAEHKAINTLEAGLTLTTENALRASRIHPRCGTSFIFVVLMIDLIVVTFLPRFGSIPARFVLQVAIVPLVAGISYELIKFAGKFRRNPLVMAVFAPGTWTQYLTPREPDSPQTEVALAALYSVLAAEGHSIPQNDFFSNPHASNLDEPAAALA